MTIDLIDYKHIALSAVGFPRVLRLQVKDNDAERLLHDVFTALH